MTDSVLTGLIAGGVSLATALITAFFTNKALTQDTKKAVAAQLQAAERLHREFQLEFTSEQAAHALLNDRRWTMRSFEVVKHHLGGFEDDELRKLLVRAGAIRFTSRSGNELWGLLTRTRGALGIGTVPDLVPERVEFLGEDHQVNPCA